MKLKCRKCKYSFATKATFRDHYNRMHGVMIKNNDPVADFALGALAGVAFDEFVSSHCVPSSDPSPFHGDGGSFGGGGSSGSYDSSSSDSSSSSSDSGGSSSSD